MILYVVGERLSVRSGSVMTNQHVSRHEDGGWKVLGAGNSKATSRHETQREAIEAARKIAQNQGSEVVIHGRDGKIRAKDSYGNDPFPPKG
jgi:hypothetical protein